MNLAPWQDIPFGDPEAMEDFRLSLQLNHNKIAQKMFAANLLYKTYPLIDADEHNKDWQQNLQQELGSVYTLLNLTGLPDISGTDLTKENDFQTFMQLLVFAEGRVNAVLGIQ